MLLGWRLLCTFSVERDHQWSLLSVTEDHSLRIWTRTNNLPDAISFCKGDPINLDGVIVSPEGSKTELFKLDVTPRSVVCDAQNMPAGIHIVFIPDRFGNALRIRVNTSVILTRNPLKIAASFNYAISGTATRDKPLVLRQFEDDFARAVQYVYETLPEDYLSSSKEEVDEMAKYILDLSNGMLPGIETRRSAFRTAVNEAYRVYGEVYLTVGDNGDVSTSFTNKASPWIHTTHNILDITDIGSVQYVLGDIKVDRIVSEHVWEHLRYSL